MKRIVVLSDMQIPLHNKPAINAVIKFVKDYQPGHGSDKRVECEQT